MQEPSARGRDQLSQLILTLSVCHVHPKRGPASLVPQTTMIVMNAPLDMVAQTPVKTSVVQLQHLGPMVLLVASGLQPMPVLPVAPQLCHLLCPLQYAGVLLRCTRLNLWLQFGRMSPDSAWQSSVRLHCKGGGLQHKTRASQRRPNPRLYRIVLPDARSCPCACSSTSTTIQKHAQLTWHRTLRLQQHQGEVGVAMPCIGQGCTVLCSEPATSCLTTLPLLPL